MFGTVLVSTQSGGHGDEILRIREKARWTQHWGWSPPQLEVEALQTQNQVLSQELEGPDAQCCKFSSNDHLNKRLHLGYVTTYTSTHAIKSKFDSRMSGSAIDPVVNCQEEVRNQNKLTREKKSLESHSQVLLLSNFDHFYSQNGW